MASQFPFHGIFSSLGQEPLEQSPLEEEVAAVAGPFSGGTAPAPTFHEPVVRTQQQAAKGQVAVDIYEQDNYYIIKAPIAGVRLSDLDIEIADNVITIRGSRQQTDNIASDQYYLQECFWGEFARSVTLPMTIDPKKVRATFNKECILKILIPKEEKVKIVRISEV
jgi:HSP20 family molecular chaperone IbpA